MDSSTTDLAEDIKSVIEDYYWDDPEGYYITAGVLTVFIKYLRSRRWYSTDDMISEINEMRNLPAGDFREGV